MAKQSGPQGKVNNDLLWSWFCNEKWIEHQKEVFAWEGHYPSYNQDEYISKNKDFLIDLWIETFWPGHILVKPDKSK